MQMLKRKCDQLHKELDDKQYTNFDLEEKISDLEEVINNVTSTEPFHPFIFKK